MPRFFLIRLALFESSHFYLGTKTLQEWFNTIPQCNLLPGASVIELSYLDVCTMQQERR